MPGRVEGPGGAVKRKRVESRDKPSKRSRSESSEEDVQARVLLLETQIFESKKNYNNISTLIKLSRNEDEDPDVSLVASIALCRIFSRLMAAGDFIKAQSTTEKESVVALWLRERYSEYRVVLLQLLNREASGSTALTLCLRMLKSEGTHLRNGQEYSFPSTFFKDILQSLLSPGCGDAVRREFREKYLEEYDDIRFYTFAAIE
jgi:U3 small nucleolar RNA-associated protein 19